MYEQIEVLNQFLSQLPNTHSRQQYLEGLGEVYQILQQSPKVFIDSRDYQVYPIIRIGQQKWFGENLRYAHPKAYLNPYNPNWKYGYLYTYQQALDLCPEGWHLPSDEEWKTLEQYLGMTRLEANDEAYRGMHEGKWLKSAFSWGEKLEVLVPEENNLEFNALAAGSFWMGGFYSLGLHAHFWTSTPYGVVKAWYRQLYKDSHQIYRYVRDKGFAYSCRYIKNTES